MTSNPLLTSYRMLAYATGCALLLLCGCMVAKYGFGVGGTLTMYVAITHGYLYLAYFVVAFFLGLRLRWRLGKFVLVLLAGTVPLCSFIAERRVVRDASGPREAAKQPAGV